MSAETLALLVRLVGTAAGAVVALSAMAVWLRYRRLATAAWTVAAGLALGCATWIHAGAPRAAIDVLPSIAAAWLVPALAAAVATRRWRVAAVAVGIAGSILAALAQPFWDPDCSGACRPQDALIAVDPHLSTVGGLILAAGAVVLAAANAHRAPLAVVAACAGAYWAVDAALPLPSASGAIVALALAASGIVAGIVVWPPALRTARARAGLRRLADPVETALDRAQVERLLASAVGDPSVRLLLPGERGSRHSTSIVRDDVLVATIDSAHPLDPHRVESALTPAVRIGIDDQRLRHDIALQIDELEASRVRLLEASDRERRRLERNVHDGAQQFLIATLARLGLSGDDTEATATGVRQALERLRSMTRGVASPVLDSAGFAPALAALADRTDVRLDITGAALEGRPARDVYVIVAAAASAADRLGIPVLTVRVEESSDAVVVRMTPADAVAGRLGDRVAALGGREQPGAGEEWVVTLPCA